MHKGELIPVPYSSICCTYHQLQHVLASSYSVLEEEERHRDRHKQTQTDMEKDRDTNKTTETERQTDKHRVIDRPRQTETQTDTDRQTDRYLDTYHTGMVLHQSPRTRGSTWQRPRRREGGGPETHPGPQR